MDGEPDPPLAPAAATECLRTLVDLNPELILTKHSKEQMAERGLLVGDILHVLKHGYVHEEAQTSTRTGYYKYLMECTTPNSNGRTVRIVVIPSPEGKIVKIITVMWKDR